MAYTNLTPRYTPSARVEEISRDSSHYLLSIPSGKADEYRLAQLDDYALFSRGRFPHRFPFSVSISARTSAESIPGTWGFGLWNDPFGLSLGFGGKPWRLPALPNAVWFFGASKENYLSFRAERSVAKTKRALPTEFQFESSQSITNRASSTDGAIIAPSSAQREVANGFIAQSFRSPRFHPLLILAGLALPFSRKLTRRLMGKVIGEDGIELSRGDPSGSAKDLHPSRRVAPTDWHRYRLEWREKRVSFEVDNVQVFESVVSPNPPLGLVIWIDNQYAAFTPEGKIGFGVLENPEPAWLEIKDLDVSV
jgi:hypothetical protein